MKKILAFGASSSSESINQELAEYAANRIKDADVDIITMKIYEQVPIFSLDKEKEGIPVLIQELWEKFKSYDGFVVSFAEHNGSYSAVFKNTFDWLSRIEGGVWNGKPILIMGTSPGARGAQTVIKTAADRFEWNNGKVFDTFSLPEFGKHFDHKKGITHDAKLEELNDKLKAFVNHL